MQTSDSLLACITELVHKLTMGQCQVTIAHLGSSTDAVVCSHAWGLAGVQGTVQKLHS